jgi:uncharacterized membrane protein
MMRAPWLVVGLIASLVLNLFLVGAAAGVIALGVRMAKEAPRPRPGALFWATQDLPQPDRRAMRQMLGAVRRGVLADSDRSLNLRADAWGGLAAGQPNVAAIKQQLTQSRQIDIAVRTRVEERIVDYVAGLSPQDRAIFAAGMRRVLRPPAAAPQPTNAATNAAQ